MTRCPPTGIRPLRSRAGVGVPFAFALLAALLCGAALAQPNATKPAGKEKSSPLGDLSSNKEPIKIDSDRLDVFDREGRAVFSGNVVAVQGDSTMNCASMNVFYEQAKGAPGAPKPPSTGALGGDNSSIKKIECKGPVTVASKTQVATGDNAEFDRTANRVYIIGNATVSDGPNVTRGDRIVYDLNTGTASVEGTRRVRALFVPGGNKDGAKDGSDNKKPPR